MPGSAKSALVLQGGGALGAYELGAARAFYKEPRFSPDLIAGVSIGAVTAVLLARPKAPVKLGLRGMSKPVRFRSIVNTSQIHHGKWECPISARCESVVSSAEGEVE